MLKECEAQLVGRHVQTRAKGRQVGRYNGGAHLDVGPDEQGEEGVADVGFSVVEEDSESERRCEDGTV